MALLDFNYMEQKEKSLNFFYNDFNFSVLNTNRNTLIHNSVEMIERFKEINFNQILKLINDNNFRYDFIKRNPKFYSTFSQKTIPQETLLLSFLDALAIYKYCFENKDFLIAISFFYELLQDRLKREAESNYLTYLTIANCYINGTKKDYKNNLILFLSPQQLQTYIDFIYDMKYYRETGEEKEKTNPTTYNFTRRTGFKQFTKDFCELITYFVDTKNQKPTIICYDTYNPINKKDFEIKGLNIFRGIMDDKDKEKVKVNKIDKEKKYKNKFIDNSDNRKDLIDATEKYKSGEFRTDTFNKQGQHLTFLSTDTSIAKSLIIKNKTYNYDLSKLKINTIADVFDFIYTEIAERIANTPELKEHKQKMSLALFGAPVIQTILTTILAPKTITFIEKDTQREIAVNYDFIFSADDLYDLKETIKPTDTNKARTRENIINAFMYFSSLLYNRVIEIDGQEKPLIKRENLFTDANYDENTNLIYLALNMENKLEIAKNYLVDRKHTLITENKDKLKTIHARTNGKQKKELLNYFLANSGLEKEIKAEMISRNEKAKKNETYNKDTMLNYFKTTFTKPINAKRLYDLLEEAKQITTDKTKSFNYKLKEMKKALDTLQDNKIIIYKSIIADTITALDEAKGQKNTLENKERKQKFFDSDIGIRLILDDTELKKIINKLYK